MSLESIPISLTKYENSFEEIQKGKKLVRNSLSVHKKMFPNYRAFR